MIKKVESDIRSITDEDLQEYMTSLLASSKAEEGFVVQLWSLFRVRNDEILYYVTVPGRCQSIIFTGKCAIKTFNRYLRTSFVDLPKSVHTMDKHREVSI